MANRGRKPIVVDFNSFQDAIVSVEWDGPHASRNALWQAVSATPYAQSIKLSPQVAMLKAKGFADAGKPLMIITPLGKKGRSKGEAPVVNRESKPKGTRRIPLDIVKEMKKHFPPSLHSKVDRAAKGSMKSAITLACVECSGGQKGEVAKCTIKTCPLWAFRPYKGKVKV